VRGRRLEHPRLLVNEPAVFIDAKRLRIREHGVLMSIELPTILASHRVSQRS